MKKYINATLSIFIAFVLVSSLFLINGNVYAQETTIQSQTNATENTPHDNAENATPGHVVRDSAVR